MSEELQTVRIAVIGVGSAGLAALKQAVDAFNRQEVVKRVKLDLVGYETRSEVGGLWNYVSEIKPFAQAQRIGEDGVVRTFRYPTVGENPTPFYENLRATLPGDLSAFRDLPFPEDAPEIPWGSQVHQYLQAYADKYDLRKYTRFNTRVERLHYTPPGLGRKWTLESSGPDGRRVEQFDFVSVTNGHYSDCYIPPIPGLEKFAGEVIHSREYRRPEDHVGKRIVVVGAGNSGADIVRHLSSLNLGHYTYQGQKTDDQADRPYTTVYQSVTGASRAGYNLGTEPWTPYIRTVPTIHHIEGPSDCTPAGVIHLQDDSKLEDIDLIIFATGYNNSLPFAKADDEPWASANVLDEVITQDERVGGDEWEIGGVKGLHMVGLDELLLFLKDDRSIAFPGLPYQIVPFPFSEVQARITSLLWAGLLPNFPSHPILPSNPSTAVPTPPQTPPPDVKPVTTPITARISESTRKELIFAVPYEWTYTEYLFDLMKAADGGDEVPLHWKEVEKWRVERRFDVGLRKRGDLELGPMIGTLVLFADPATTADGLNSV